MTVQQSTQQLLFSLFHIYEEREARNIVDLVMESVTGWKRIDRIINKQVPVSKDMEILLADYTQNLLIHKPVQYVLHEAWFYDMKFYVDEHVLIPRPETEELVRWALAEVEANHINILDIGTGSGCIAIALKKKLPGAQLYACDVSEKALEVAAKNAESNKTQVAFVPCDFLNSNERTNLPVADIIVSNPPYVPRRDMETMHQHVTGYEPHLALFVADNDPLLFYREIAGFAQTHLSDKGQIFVELHEDMGSAVREVFRLSGFEDLELRQDMQGKNRMLKAMRMRADKSLPYP